MQSLLSIIIPAYNGEPFLEYVIHSLINDRLQEEGVYDLYEIIIINDGSKDNTKAKALAFAKLWNPQIRPNFIKVINKKNNQYGSVINRGIKEAKGAYFKVLDCDDTFNVSSFIDVLYALASIDKRVDLVLTDFTFEKVGTNKQILNTLRKYFEPYKILNLTKQKMPNDLMTMHSYIYRTNFLREIKFKQIEQVYYSDSQYALIPLVKAKTLYYINRPLYRYYVGRSEQSINLKTMVKNREHQQKVLNAIFKDVKVNQIQSKYVREYAIMVLRQMVQWNIMIMAVSKRIRNKPKALRKTLVNVKRLQPKYYKKIIKGPLFLVIKLTRGHLISFIIKVGIKIYSKFRKNILAEWD